MKQLDKRSARSLQEAMKAHQAGKFDVACVHYEAVLARRPQDADALHFYGVLRHNQHRSGEGTALIRRSLEVTPHNPHAWLNLGNILLEQEQSSDAKAAYERSASLAPDLADAWYNLGICLRKMEEAQAAVRALDRALELRPTHAPSRYQRGIAHREMGDTETAELDFRRALQLKIDYTEVFESLGMLLYRQNRIKDAAQVYRAWLEQDPCSSIAGHMAAATSGEAAPVRGSDAYVTETFDRFAATFDQNLANLLYQAPQLVAAALTQVIGDRKLDAILDAGVGTGLCGELLRPLAKRLVGVDLSSQMVAIATDKGHYDELYVDELSRFMQSCAEKFDAVVSADTFVYFGALEEAMQATAHCLQVAGTLVMTLEEMAADGVGNYRLEPHGRYSHRIDYVYSALQSAGFETFCSEERVLRRERGADVRGMVIVARMTMPPA